MTSPATPSAAPYRGADRRHRGDEAQAPGQLPLLPAAAALVVALTAAAVVTTTHAVRGEALHDTLQVLRAALLTGAGLLCLVRWRTTGLTRPAFIGVALVVLGVLAESIDSLAPLVHGRPEFRLPDRLATTAAALAAAVLLLSARRAPAVDAAARPTRLLLVVAVSVPLLCAGGVALAATVGERDAMLPLAVAAVLLAALWCWLAASEHRAGLDRRAPWLVPVLGCLAASGVLGAVAAYDAEPAAAAAAVLALAAGVVAVHGAAGDLQMSLSAQSQSLLQLTVDVHDHQQQQRSAQRTQEERLHEVRNVLAGLHGATATLRKYEDRLDPGVRRRLEDAVTGELRRLSHLLDPTLAAPLVDVALAEALAPVVVAEREQGADLWVDLHVAAVKGRPGDVATVVSALLVNARRHAPGSPVVLRADASEGETRVYVEDRGRGVPLAQRHAVFERGERAGATVPGSGLGLYTARRLAEEMGGTLQVYSRPGGGASFVLTLPSAAGCAAQLGEDAPQAGEVAHHEGGLPHRVSVPGQRRHDPRPDLRLARGRGDGTGSGPAGGDGDDALDLQRPANDVRHQLG